VSSLKYLREMADRLGLRWLRAHTHLPALGRWRVGVLLALGGVLLLFVVFVSVDGGLYYDQTHYGVSVAGRDLGGLSRDEAIAALTTFVQGTRKRLIILTGGDKSWKVLPGDVGTTVDVAASVSAAMRLTRGGDVFSDLGRRIELYFSGRDLPLQGAVDDAKLDELVHQFATELDRQPVDARMVVDANQVTITEEQPGALVDKQALRDQLTALLFTMDGAELQIPMITVKPEIGVANLSPALEGARTMISSELALTYGHKTWTLTPEDIASFMDLTYRTVDGVTTAAPAFSVEKMGPFLEGVAGSVDRPAANATMDSDGKSVWVVPSADGQALDREGTAAALAQAALWVGGRTAEVALTVVEPDLTTGAVTAMGVSDLLGRYATTPYRGSGNRQNNVRLGTSLCSGILLAPGEEFDTDKRFGKRDRAHGWRRAPGIVGGGVLKQVYGGGICQVSTTLFNAVFEAGLEVVERYNHSMYISHYPPGRDATVAGDGGKNMRFRNDTDHYIFVWGMSTGVVTEFFIWGVSDGRTVTSSFSGSRSTRCTVTRTVTWPDGTVKTDKFASHYIY
jgi:vancomycin resistance protein YoaR